MFTILRMVNPTLKKEVIDVDQLSEERPAYEDFVPCHVRLLHLSTHDYTQ